MQNRGVTGLGQRAKKITFANGLKDNESVVKRTQLPAGYFGEEEGRRPQELRR